jgi:hypothetical protein
VKATPSVTTLYCSFKMAPPQRIIDRPVQTPVRRADPVSGAVGSADQRFAVGSNASPLGGVLPPQISSRLPVHTAGKFVCPVGIGASARQGRRDRQQVTAVSVLHWVAEQDRDRRTQIVLSTFQPERLGRRHLRR